MSTNLIEGSYRLELEKIAREVTSDPPEARVGDLVVLSMGRRKPRRGLDKLTDDTYRFLSPKFQGQYTHAGIYAGDGQIIEAVQDGVRKAPLSKFRHLSYVIASPKDATDDQRREAVEWAEKQVGTKYTNKLLVGAGVSSISPKRGLVQKYLAGRDEVQGIQCGGLVAEAWDRAGIKVDRPTAAQFTAPSDLLLSKDTVLTGKLVRGAHAVTAADTVPFGRTRKDYIRKMEIEPSKENKRKNLAAKAGLGALVATSVGSKIWLISKLMRKTAAESKRVWTPQMIHRRAAAFGIPWDSEKPGSEPFMALCKRITGKEHLDDMSPEDLKRVARALAIMRTKMKPRKPGPREVKKFAGKPVIPLTDADRSELGKRLKRIKQSPGSVSLKHTADGYCVHTHRARSKFYETPGSIPLSKLRFIASTG